MKCDVMCQCYILPLMSCFHLVCNCLGLWLALFFGLFPIWSLLYCCFACGPFEDSDRRSALGMLICFGPGNMMCYILSCLAHFYHSYMFHVCLAIPAFILCGDWDDD